MNLFFWDSLYQIHKVPSRFPISLSQLSRLKFQRTEDVFVSHSYTENCQHLNLAADL